MKNLFLSAGSGPRERWLAAFPDLEQVNRVLEIADISDAEEGPHLVWVDLAALSEPWEAIAKLVEAGHKVVVLSATPGEAEAFSVLARGVRGYCHREAAPKQLQEVAEVIKNGGLWMPPALVQRLITVGQRVDTGKAPASPDYFADLTPREEEVALMVGRGFNNREIAEALSVSERTVKANLTAIFEKLGLRDRVQLALYVNRLPIH
ncbi:helix-turn-helix transcriptional regulator [Congregibacter litoralis]|uniref:Transcriptional regulator, LuxR family n=1 Tax=Congregibacter litoralis KT71 TaxID=314285 RepID=A4A584_9GAMM|nr:response regulator transcription factor [Congregibacter litoralis]EAQ98955.1 transcriptional regulator, LuxR family [Congregibacter litoralis KT71]